MCDSAKGHDHDHGADGAQALLPRPVTGSAADPITLEPVDEIVITTLVDNSYDGLMIDMGPAKRTAMGRTPKVPSAVFDGGQTVPGLVAEHGFSALVTMRRGDRKHSVLFDTGVTPYGLARNMERLEIDTGGITAVVLSHGHFDHAGGLEGLARGRTGLPLVLHPHVWSRRRVALPNRPPWDLPTLSRQSVEAEGFEVIERRQPSALLDGSLLVTGEIDRTTDFEHGMPFHEALRGDSWEPDPLILDDQALVAHVRDRGLVVLTGCGHGGAVNIARHALRLTGVDRLHALLGGFHLNGPAFEPVIEPTLNALAELAPDVIVPAHCTGWKAQLRLAETLPGAFIPNSVGTSFHLAAA